MVIIVKRNRSCFFVSTAKIRAYMQGSCEIAVGKISAKPQSFFHPIERQVSKCTSGCSWFMALSSCVGYSGMIDKVVKRDTMCYANHDEFLWWKKVQDIIEYNHEELVIHPMKKLLAA